VTIVKVAEMKPRQKTTNPQPGSPPPLNPTTPLLMFRLCNLSVLWTLYSRMAATRLSIGIGRHLPGSSSGVRSMWYWVNFVFNRFVLST
jgi:hypothetical protein